MKNRNWSTGTYISAAIYQGERIYFCTRACLRVFEQDPSLFMSGKIKHPIHEDEM